MHGATFIYVTIALWGYINRARVRACASSDSFSTLSASLALWRCSSLAASCSARASASDDAHVACAPPS